MDLLVVTDQELSELKLLVNEFVQKGGKVYVCEPFAKSKTFRTLADKHSEEYEAKKLKKLKKKQRQGRPPRRKKLHGNAN
jgi:hypothetical protein